jgi:hypothetical protein
VLAAWLRVGTICWLGQRWQEHCFTCTVPVPLVQTLVRRRLLRVLLLILLQKKPPLPLLLLLPMLLLLRLLLPLLL